MCARSFQGILGRRGPPGCLDAWNSADLAKLVHRQTDEILDWITCLGRGADADLPGIARGHHLLGTRKKVDERAPIH